MAWCPKHQCELTGLPAYAWCPQCEKEPVASGDADLQKWHVRFSQLSQDFTLNIATGRVITYDSKGNPALDLSVRYPKFIKPQDAFDVSFNGLGKANKLTIWGKLDDEMTFQISKYEKGWV